MARTHYLGKPKRRTFCGETSAHGLPGDDLIAAANGEPCGKLILSAQLALNRHAVLFEVQLSALAGGQLLLAGQLVTPRSLPYQIPTG